MGYSGCDRWLKVSWLGIGPRRQGQGVGGRDVVFVGMDLEVEVVMDMLLDMVREMSCQNVVWCEMGS